MSDLISRSKLLEELKSLKIVLNGKQIFSDDSKNTVLRIVNEQPTAYDIDKVVKEIEANGKNTDVCISKIRAIKIVKHGVVADDVCEWYVDNKGNYKCKAHAETYDSRVLDWNLCPYCSKKIKVVEMMERLSLDELIAQERKIAEHNHNMYEFECMCYGKDIVDSEEKMDCVKEYEYHSQLVELLEELKARREADRISDSKPFDVLLVQRYNKALDDFVEKLCKAFDETTLNDDGYYPNNVVRSIAEQLKAGGENE